MSQDLLAEFGSFSINEGSQASDALTRDTLSAAPVTSQTGHVNTSAEDAWADGEEEDDDDFGDFEAAGEGMGQEVFGKVQSSKLETPTVKKPTTTGKATKPEPALQEKKLSRSHPFASNSDVFFDAEDPAEIYEAVEEAEEDDDFGDFETTAAPAARKPDTMLAQQNASASQASQSATFDFLGLDNEPLPQPKTKPKGTNQVSRTAKVAPSNPPIRSIRKEIFTPESKAPQIQTTVNQDDDFSAWDDFESVTAQPISPSLPAKTIQTSSALQARNETETLIALPTELLGSLLIPPPSITPTVPTNIPPPSLLLTLFPDLIRAITTTLLQPLSTLNQAQKQQYLRSVPAHNFLKVYLIALHVLAHTIAGRKSRWKRDKFLAQSMRIGPSVSGRSGGMKLAGLDSNEQRREEAEVEDVLKVYREQIGRLKSAVAVSIAEEEGPTTVPELASVMPVRIAKGAEGGVVSTIACAFCGLKREERVAKVDVNIEDSFGEWWVEGTNMHLGCLNFWEAHKERLRGR